MKSWGNSSHWWQRNHWNLLAIIPYTPTFVVSLLRRTALTSSSAFTCWCYSFTAFVDLSNAKNSFTILWLKTAWRTTNRSSVLLVVEPENVSYASHNQRYIGGTGFMGSYCTVQKIHILSTHDKWSWAHRGDNLKRQTFFILDRQQGQPSAGVWRSFNQRPCHCCCPRHQTLHRSGHRRVDLWGSRWYKWCEILLI